MEISRKKGIRCIIYLFIFYCVVLFYFFFANKHIYNLLFVEYVEQSINLIPLRGIMKYINLINNHQINVDIFIKNLCGNFFAFLPMGFLLPYIFKQFHSCWKLLFTVFIIRILIDCTQLFLRIGKVDIDFIIISMVGTLVGYGILKILSIKQTSE